MTGPYDDHTAKIEISPWPYIKSGERAKVRVTFTPGKLVMNLNTEIQLNELK